MQVKMRIAAVFDVDLVWVTPEPCNLVTSDLNGCRYNHCELLKLRPINLRRF
jgi:hypothetical protein